MISKLEVCSMFRGKEKCVPWLLSMYQMAFFPQEALRIFFAQTTPDLALSTTTEVVLLRRSSFTRYGHAFYDILQHPLFEH